MKSLLASMGCEEAERHSRLAADRLMSLPEYRKADIILAFLSRSGEILTGSLVGKALADGKKVAVPRMEGSGMAGDFITFIPLDSGYLSWPRDRFGIPEPPSGAKALSKSELENAPVIIVTPGLAFDRSGGRLGRGRGYYDRFLKEARSARSVQDCPVFACGLCYASQLVDKVPSGEFDAQVDLVITEEGEYGR